MVMMKPLLPIIDLVIIGYNSIITMIIGNNEEKQEIICNCSDHKCQVWPKIAKLGCNGARTEQFDFLLHYSNCAVCRYRVLSYSRFI